VLYRHGILAFETLAMTENLAALERLEDDADFAAFAEVFAEIDALEQVHYYQIVKGRLAVIEKFQGLADEDAKEKVVQQHIFDHLWLLDASWERATTDERMEQSVMAEFAKVDVGLTPEERAGRIDIRYKTVAGKHVIIELKRYGRTVKATELAEQVNKYRRALSKCLVAANEPAPHFIESICILGAPPEPADEPKIAADVLAAVGARFLTYEQLIQQTRHSYRDYIDANVAIGRIHELIDRI
jgi:hypothetical protein